MNYRVYPVVKCGDVAENYKVYIDGKEAELNTARVSACPFNRRWPGHQRQIEQSELVNFLSMSISGKVRFKVVPEVKPETVAIRPSSLGITPAVNADGSIEFDLDKPAKFSVEVNGYNNALHIFADGEKDYGIDKNAANVLYFGAGEHHPGVIELKDGQTMFVEEGAVVYATIKALGVNNIKILGRGIIDNSENKERILFETNAEDGNGADVGNAERDFLGEIDICENVEIDGVTLRDSLAYNLNFCSCKNVVVNNVKCIGNWRYNSDGIHFVNCIGGSLTDSFLRTYDDSVCVRGYVAEEMDRLKDTSPIEECRDIVIKNNVLWNDWGTCFRIGAGTLGKEVCNVVFENNDIVHYTFFVLDSLLCDNADVHHFLYKNNNIELDGYIRGARQQMNEEEKFGDQPLPETSEIVMIAFKVLHHFEYSDRKYNKEGKAGSLGNFVVDGINLIGGENFTKGIIVTGFDKEGKCHDIVIKNIYHNGKKLTKDDVWIYTNEFCENLVFED